MTTASLIQQTISFGTEPPVVTCAVETPSGQVDVYQYGVDPQIARSSAGNYQIQIPQAVNGTAANPYIFYWQPGGVLELFPGSGVVIPPPVPPPEPPPAVVPNLVPSGQPGLFTPGLVELGEPNGTATIAPVVTPPPPVVTANLIPSAQPGLFTPGYAEPGIPNQTATLPPTPSPGPAPTIMPDTTSGFHQALIFNYNAGSTPETGIDYVWGSSSASGLAGIHERYVPWSQSFNTTTYPLSWFQANHPDWLLYQLNQTSVAVYNGDATRPALDYTNAAVRSWLITNFINPQLALGFKGISFDDNPSYNQYSAAGHFSSPGVWVAQYSGSLNDGAWASAQATALGQIITQVHATYPNATFTVNNGYFPEFSQYSLSTTIWDPIINTNGVSGLLDEFAFSSNNAGVHLDVGRGWAAKMAKLSGVAATKALTLLYEEGYTVTANMTGTNATAKADLQWALGNYFLCKGSATYFFWGGASQYGFAPIAQTEFSACAPIGNATNTYFSSQGVYRRDFSNGVVFVNPATSTNVSLTNIIPASTYKDLYGTVQPASFTLNAVSGIVLIHV